MRMPGLTYEAPGHNSKLLLLCCVLCQPALDGWTQPYPAKIVRYVIPGSPGAGTDLVGRIMAAGLTDAFGRQVIVDNRPGGGNNIGAEIAAKAPPDGYTLLHISIPMRSM